MPAVKVIISGRVQGVGYRAWTISTARKMGLDGWVRNLKDGTVEAVFSGDGALVERMIEACWKGPLISKVTAVDRSDGEAPEAGFKMLGSA